MIYVYMSYILYIIYIKYILYISKYIFPKSLKEYLLSADYMLGTISIIGDTVVNATDLKRKSCPHGNCILVKYMKVPETN